MKRTLNAFSERKSGSPYVKDGFHRRLIEGDEAAVNPAQRGTKAAAWYRLNLAPGESAVLRFRLMETAGETQEPFGPAFDETFASADGRGRCVLFFAKSHGRPV